MNKIFKVIYSKTKHCYVVVSELTKSHCKSTQCNTAKSKTALTAAVLLALGAFSFVGMPVVQADGTESLRNNDFVGANDQYWYYDENDKEWKTYQYKLTSAFNNRARGDLPNYQGGGAKFPGAVTAGLYAQAGQQTVTIGDRNAGQSKGSVFIGEHSGYNNGNNDPAGMKNNYVTSVGFQSDATGWGSIAIGSNATAENSKMESQVVKEVGKANTSGTVSDDTYGIEENPTIQGASVALGYNAHSKDGNIAIGSYSDATSTDKNDSYVSVGNANLKRRITNVAEGTNASDVATVGQLMALEAKSGTYKAGFGIEITPGTDKKENTISLDRNLGNDYNTTDDVNLKNDAAGTSLILGGRVEKSSLTGGQSVTGDYGALGKDSVTVGGVDNTVETTGNAAVVVGGIYNKAAGTTSAVVGGSANDAIGNESAVFGGQDNDAYETYATISGGSWNKAYGNASSIFGGSVNDVSGRSSVAVGGYGSHVYGDVSVGIAGGSTNADYALAAGNEATVTINNGTAIGYQAMANKEGTVAFGHDKGDVYYTSTWPQKATEKDGKYYDAQNNEITKDQYEALKNADLTFNDYSQKPTVTENKYDAAGYNRLVKVADGVDDHDVVVMEQLKNAKNDLKVNAGWGINVADVTTKNDDDTETTTKNVISLNRNLGTNLDKTGHVYLDVSKTGLVLGTVVDGAQGTDTDLHYGATGDYAVTVGGGVNTASGKASVVLGGSLNKASNEATVASGGYSNVASGSMAAVYGGSYNEASGADATILGGELNKASNTWTAVGGGASNEASGIYASVWGGSGNKATDNSAAVYGGLGNSAYGLYSAILGGGSNKAGAAAVVSGGASNEAAGLYSAVLGGEGNIVTGANATAVGGVKGSVNGVASVGILGGSTGINAPLTLAAGYQSTVTDTGVTSTPITEEEAEKFQEEGTHPGLLVGSNDPDNLSFKILDHFATAVGYQATADEAQTVAFGHDKGDTYYGTTTYTWKQKATVKDGHYYDEYNQEIDKESYESLKNADGTWNDYTQPIATVEEKKYDSAYYNRLVKVADGIDDHDVVVMEQLKQYAEKDASNLGSNIKVYKTDENGNVQLDNNKMPIEDKDATTTAQNANKDAWGRALGADPFTAGTATTATNASTSDQLVTGKTLYNYDAPVAETGKKLNYVSANNTTGQNLSALDAQVKANADKGLKFAANSGDEYTAKLGSTVKIQGTAKKEGHEYTADNLTTEIDKDGNITILMDKDMSVEKLAVNGKDGKEGAPGTPGSIGISGQDGQSGVGIDGKDGISIKGKDGKDGVTMKAVDGKDGTEGHIGLTGPAGTNGIKGADGQTGTSIDITVKNGYDGANGVNGKNGVDGTSLTRIVYKDGAGEHQVATMEDGLKFKGDDGTEIAKKLNNTMEIIGGADSTRLTDKNIGVNSDGDKLKVQLSKDLTGMNSTTYTTTTGEGESATTSTTVVNGNGLTITDGPSITNKGIDGGNKVITKVGSGIEKDATGNITEASKTNAANIGDVQTIAESTATSLTDKGLKFAANSGAEYTAKLGSTVKIQGTEKKEGHEYTADNLTTEIDENGNITILMDKDMSVEKLAVNGKDGKEGAPGTPGSIGISGQDGQSGVGIDGKDGISIKGKDGKDGVTMKAVDGKDGTEGHIGLTGPAGTNGIKGADGQTGTSIDITVKNGYDGANGVNGKNGVDGTSLTRIVYKDGAGEHQVATMEDGLKFKGDDGTEIAKKLNNTMEIIGGADSTRLTDKNIGVNSDGDKLKVQLSKDLTGMNSTTYTTTTGEGESATTSTTVVNGNGLTITDGPSITNKGIDGGNKVITKVGSGIEKDATGNITEASKTNAANIGDVQNMVNDAKTELISGDNGLNNKANIDASNIGANLKGEDGKTPASDDEKTTNENAWGKAIGTGKIEANNGQLVTGDTVYNEVRPKEDGNYVKTNQTTGANLSALDSKIGKLDETKKYNYIDSKESTSISDNLTKLDTQVKKNADDITNINNSISSLNQNAVKYDDSSKSKISLGGEGGTTITNVKDGSVKKDSTDAVNGGQLWQVDQKVDTNTTNITKNAGDITNLKNLSNITDAGKTVIKNLSKDAVQIKAGTAITVDGKVDETTGNKTYTISANNNGKVAKDDGNLISGDTLYKEVHVDSDGSYIKSNNTVGQNLSALDSGLKTTSDLIHTNAKGDTIQIGGNSTATKIDVSGKDKDGNTTGRVITGVMTDGKDLTSAANVGYVNGITSANTQQIYRDMNNAYSRLDTNINRAAAGSNALAALHPLDFDPADKASYAVGYGHYHNANAAAVGAFYQPNANTMVNMGISLGNGDPGFNAGVSFKIGKGSAYNGVSKAEMAQTIHDQAEEISAIKANDAAKDKRIDALEKENQEMKKQIQEILSRLNG